MSKTFEERVEEVLGELHGMAWPLLEEPQKRKIMSKVAKGIDQGDSYTAWGRALGTSDNTIRRQIERLRRSEPIDGPAPSNPETDARKLRAARAVLEDERLSGKLLDDPRAARGLAKAAQKHEARIEAVVRREQQERAPGLVAKANFNEAAGELLRARKAAQKSLEIARNARFKKDEREALLEDVLNLANVAAFYESFLNGDVVDWDEALSELEG